MKKFLMFLFLGTLPFIFSGCFVEAELTSLRSEMKPFDATDSIAVSPSFQDSGVSRSDDNNYTAELSISYQRR